jgi:hypothetical protein
MKNKLMIAFALLTLTAGSLLSVQAQNRQVEVPNKILTVNPYSLKCAPYHSGDVGAVVNLTNVGKPIPANTTIKIKTPGGTETYKYSTLFPTNTTRSATASAGMAGPCTAWVN